MQPTYLELVNALEGLLKSPDNGCGCPMCDWGRLRPSVVKAGKGHMSYCEWNNAQLLLNRIHKGPIKEEEMVPITEKSCPGCGLTGIKINAHECPECPWEFETST